MSDAPLKEKPLNGSAWTKPWHNYFDGLNMWVTGLISALKFTDLTDVPSSYTGQAGKVVKVKGAEDGLEFGTLTSAHNDLTGIQGGAVGEYYHLTSADHTEATTFLNGGSATHTQLDSERTSSIAHRADALIHFEQADIDHTAINNIGIYTHDQLDIEKDLSVLHRADNDIHLLKYDELAYTYTTGLETGEVVKLAGATLKTITKTYDSSNRISTIADGSNTWTFSYSGAGFLTGVLKT